MDLDDSLTNINWLGRFSCRGIVAEKKASSKLKSNPLSQQKAVKPPSGVPVKRPQHSYSELIKLALNNAPGRRLALQQIYAWVEDHFPFYKYHANPGWRNSIRHSLSTQDIFIREAGGGGRTSFWMMKPHTQPNVFLTLGQNKDVSSETKSKKGTGRRKMPPLLPRGVLHCLVPVPVLISPPAVSPIAVHHAPCLPTHNGTQRAIAPKLPIACCPTAIPSPAAAVPTPSRQGAVVVKHWNSSCQKGTCQRRKQRHRVLQEPELPSQSLFSISTSNDSGLGSENTVSSEQKTGSVMDSPSNFRTPVKRSCNGMVTSTPCTDPTLLSPTGALPLLGVGHTPPATLGSFLDGSFFRSSEGGVIEDEDLGLSSLRGTPSGNCHGNGSLPDFSFFSFTPIRGISQKGDECEPQASNETLPPVFPDFSLGALERGAELVNISWSDFT
ncbi:forkhead box protein M1-like isoform X2 [Conger conger]|nr:forkhead box protein M1-like isoform X2 [Conger conger]